MSEHRHYLWNLLLAIAIGMLVGCGDGGPQESPEAVTRAWLEAVVAGDCETAASYMPPDKRAMLNCGPDTMPALQYTNVKIDDIVVRELPIPSNKRKVTLVGEFKTHTIERNDLKCDVEILDGIWYLDGCFLLDF